MSTRVWEYSPQPRECAAKAVWKSSDAGRAPGIENDSQKPCRLEQNMNVMSCVKDENENAAVFIQIGPMDVVRRVVLPIRAAQR